MVFEHFHTIIQPLILFLYNFFFCIAHQFITFFIFTLFSLFLSLSKYKEREKDKENKYNGVIMTESQLYIYIYIWTLKILVSFATVSTKYFL